MKCNTTQMKQITQAPVRKCILIINDLFLFSFGQFESVSYGVIWQNTSYINFTQNIKYINLDNETFQITVSQTIIIYFNNCTSMRGIIDC